MNTTTFLVYLLILYSVYCAAPVSLGQGNCVPVQLPFKSTTCIQYGGITVATNITSHFTIQTGTLDIVYTASTQPDCNFFTGTLGASPIYPGSTTIIGAFASPNTYSPLVIGMALQCTSVQTCVGYFCNNISPFDQPANSNNAPYVPIAIGSQLVSKSYNSAEYISFSAEISANQYGQYCNTFGYPNLNEQVVLSCSDGPKPVLFYTSGMVVAGTVNFVQCSNDEAEFSVVGLGTTTTFTVSLTSGASKSIETGSCTGFSVCCYQIAATILAVTES